MKVHVRTFTSPGFGENCYVVWREGESAAVVIDPGSGVPPVLDLLARESLRVEAILLTHAHLDHVEGVARLKHETAAPIYLHPGDGFLYERAAQQGLAFGVRMDEPPPVDVHIRGSEELELGSVTYEVRHVPGHSPGHVMFLVQDAGCAFVGDVVFQGSIGRTDLPGGDFTELIASIRTHVLCLPDETVLYSGHGPETTVGHERSTNPFLIPQYGGGLA